MKKLYDMFIELNIKSAREKAARKGWDFNEEKFIKKQEAALPILFFYGIMILLGFTLPGLVELIPSWIVVVIFFGLILRGLNHYFGWIRIEN